jgi:hypothetical protein
MGFIASASTKTLTAYLTQKGREYILRGNKNDFNIKYFSLHDEDINYHISSDFLSGDYNIPNSGFIPDITGDDDYCIKSIAQGIIVSPNSVITGGTSLNSVRPLYVRFVETTKTSTLLATDNQFTDTFTIALIPPPGDNTPITASEYTSVSFTISAISISPAIKNVTINGQPNTSPIITFNSNNQKIITLTFEKDTLSPAGDNITSTIDLRFTQLSGVLERLQDKQFTYIIRLTIP